MSGTLKNYRVSHWYPLLADITFPTAFVRLHPGEREALTNGVGKGAAVKDVVSRLGSAMSRFPGNSFVFCDSAAPTDTERFKLKRGAVYSAASAWANLAASDKVKAAVTAGDDTICVRPFRRMSKPREFRLFVRNGKLKAMSQYWLTRHYRRLEGPKKDYWRQARKLIETNAWNLPVKDLALDIYFTAKGEMLVIDLNPWGAPTNPLLLRSWDGDWERERGIMLIAPPTTINGDVSVSF